jgi:hypothetical protein
VLYPLAGAVRTDAFPLGVGNHITAESAMVTVRDGTLLESNR